ncbi:conserved hypothetical protein [Trichinella spiralis]|uniref:hypothetical protein n=1 Tax=Trichinella spiralis TaxID=6334 RepID=UPI0001EFDF7C|nr:conserved hypothetical protein [Trichinella spiralis]
MVRQSCLSLRTAMTDHVTCIQKRSDQKYFEIVTQSLVAFVGAAVFHVRETHPCYYKSIRRWDFCIALQLADSSVLKTNSKFIANSILSPSQINFNFSHLLKVYSLQVIYVLVTAKIFNLSMQQEQPNVQNSSVPMKQREER